MKLFRWIPISMGLAGVLASAISNTAHAGLVSWGPKLGGNLSTLAFEDDSTSTVLAPGYGMSWSAGVSLDVGIGPISIMIDALYQNRKVGFTIPNFGESSISTNYLHVPVQARLSTGLIFFTGGMYYSHRIGAPTVTGVGASAVPIDDDSLSGSDFGAVAGVGLTLPMPALTPMIEARFNWGLSDLKNPAVEEFSMKSRSIEVLAGVLF